MMGYLLFQDERMFQRQSLALMAGMLTFLVVSTLYPTMISLRPITMPNDGLCCRLVSWLYATDTPTNVTPSIHVYNTLTVLAGFYMTDSRLSRSRRGKTTVTTISVLIIMSTLLLKQHSVLDIIAAGIMFLVVQALSMVLLPLHQNGNRSTVPALKKSESRIWTK